MSIEVCERCRGAGQEPTNPKDKADRPPIIVCRDCKGTGVPPLAIFRSSP